ncbi:MAG: hydroxymethylglutaryl-CoA lyase [Flavobacteriales bacterium]|jgi:hydroxymethylglutaryl-CoA lyase|tara:strand:- start:1 stop:849 length:849 start_codon:yes stop_codon:yes gene_type:complete
MKITECPRDAMQGIKDWIPTQTKIDYLNSILKVGFDTVDFGSFVSPKAIPQLKDTAEVLAKLDLENTCSKLLAIVANKRGAEDACNFEEIDYLGFPFSISEQFQQRNTNSSIEESLGRVQEIKSLCDQNNKKLVVYISMAFGNPYGEEWNPEIAVKWSTLLANNLGIEIMALSDTIGVSNRNNITQLFSTLIPELPSVEFGAHLHSIPATRYEKIEAAFKAGCRRMDSAISGYGGCPMATDDLTGNMATEELLLFAKNNNLGLGLDLQKFEQAKEFSTKVFN